MSNLFQQGKLPSDFEEDQMKGAAAVPLPPSPERSGQAPPLTTLPAAANVVPEPPETSSIPVTAENSDSDSDEIGDKIDEDFPMSERKKRRLLTRVPSRSIYGTSRNEL